VKTNGTMFQPLSGLKQFARANQPVEQCELCSTALEPVHRHLLERSSRHITCACDACTILFCGQQGSRYLQVPRRVRQLQGFSFTDLEWEELMIPINLAFFFRNAEGAITAMYPSPAGAIESQLALTSLLAVFDEHPVLHAMEPEVEALLVNRVGDQPAYLIAPIDKCFHLVGLIRMKWRGLSGGTEVWGAISDFFDTLRQQAGGAVKERYA
jgi:hypothetical protein